MFNEYTNIDSRDFYGYTIYEDGTILGKNGREMSCSIDSDGRKEIKLTVAPRQRKCFIVARLVYCIFNNIDYFELDKDMCVTHKDNDFSNTHISNLELKNRADLIQGEKHRNVSILTSEDVEMIRELYKNNGDRPINQYDNDGSYYSYRRLARMFGVSHANIKKIIDGESWNAKNYKL